MGIRSEKAELIVGQGKDSIREEVKMEAKEKNTSYLDEVDALYPVRRTKAEKAAFQAYVKETLARRGIVAEVEKTRNGRNENVVVGNPTTANAVFTAHYDTPARSLFPNLMIPRSSVLFYAYQCLPIIVLLIVAFFAMGIVLLCGVTDIFLTLVIVLTVYYGTFYLMFFAFKNKRNRNDNTSGVATLLSILETLRAEQLEKVAFIFFDNEEKGKLGSKAYFSEHKDSMKDKLVVNFDCVGNGKHILFAVGEVEKKAEYKALRRSVIDEGEYETAFYPRKRCRGNSDHLSFPCGVGCMACKCSKRGLLYAPYIHTPKDVEADVANVEFLFRAMSRFVDEISRESL